MGGLGSALFDIRHLDLIPRILFATDGAITHILEAYAGESVDFVRLASSPLSDPDTRDELGIGRDERALQRLNVLRGRTSGRVFVLADSVVALDRLPPAVADELVSGESSLLKLLTQRRVGTFRETIAEWEGHDDAVAARLGIDPSEVQVARTYQVVIGGRPAAWCTERFAKTGFPFPRPRPVPNGTPRTSRTSRPASPSTGHIQLP